MNRPKGFSLIELLVVIAIIGLLSTMAVVSLNSARTKARDTRRQGDIKALQTAIELYKTNNTSGGDAAPVPASNTWAALGTTLASTVTTIPMDPNNTGSYAYVYCWDTAASSSSKYLVAAALEQNIDIPSDIDTKPALNTATCVTSLNATPSYSTINCADSNGGTLTAGSVTAFCLGQG